MKKKLLLISNIVSTVLLIVAILISAWIVISKVNNRFVFFGGKTVAWVMTGSMEPDIPARSYILLSKPPKAGAVIGDVIMFYSKDPAIAGQLNTHKIVGIENGEYVTRGVNNVNNDEYTVSPGDVVGVYVRNLPLLSAFGRFLSTLPGFICVLIAIAVLMCVSFLPGILHPKDVKSEKALTEKEKQAMIDRMVREEIERLKAGEATGTANKPETDKKDNGKE